MLMWLKLFNNQKGMLAFIAIYSNQSVKIGIIFTGNQILLCIVKINHKEPGIRKIAVAVWPASWFMNISVLYFIVFNVYALKYILCIFSD